MRGIIQLTYLKVIDQTSSNAFERKVFQQTFDEFFLKCQEYNPSNSFFSFSEMVAHNAKANSLHYKSAMAISNTIKELDNAIPGLKDCIGKESIRFQKYEMKILQSNPFNIAEHVVALYFTTNDLFLHENVSEYLILSNIADKEDADGEAVHTFTVRMQPEISITSYVRNNFD